jgi:hypothetical protein
VEVDDPDFLSAIELGHVAEVNIQNIGLLKQGRDLNLLLLMATVEVMAEEISKATMEASATTLLLSLALLMLFHTFLALLVIDAALLFV